MDGRYIAKLAAADAALTALDRSLTSGGGRAVDVGRGEIW